MQAGMRLPVHGASDAFGASLPRTVAPCSGSDYCRAPGAGRGRAASLTRPHRRTDWSPVVWKSQGNRCARRSLALSPWVRSLCALLCAPRPVCGTAQLSHARTQASQGEWSCKCRLQSRCALACALLRAPAAAQVPPPRPGTRWRFEALLESAASSFAGLAQQHNTKQLRQRRACQRPDTLTQ